jgi:hypothetical protein
MSTPTLLRITDETTPSDLVKAITNLNDEAKRLSRRGYIGTRGAEYAHRHCQIDALLTELLGR